MLQLQYLNVKLKKNQIEKILSNYNIKYTTMKKEIDNKIDIMIKTFNEDISSFLNNMEEIAEQKQKLKSLEYNQNELKSVREQLKEKIHELTELKREFELLKSENNRLKNLNNKNNNKKGRFFSPSFRFSHNKTLNNSSFNNTKNNIININETKSFILKTENKDNTFKSTLIEKSKKKINELILDDNKKKIKIRLKKDIKNSLSNSINSELKTESKLNLQNNKKKDNIFVIKKQLFNKNKDLTKSYISVKNSKKKIKNMKKSTNILSSTRNLKKKDYNTMAYEGIIKKSEDKSYEKDNLIVSKNNINNEDSESESSEKTNEEQNDDINNEINEMNDIEEEIISIIDQIKEFKKDLT